MNWTGIQKFYQIPNGNKLKYPKGFLSHLHNILHKEDTTTMSPTLIELEMHLQEEVCT